jgi:hypothetical protein
MSIALNDRLSARISEARLSARISEARLSARISEARLSARISEARLSARISEARLSARISEARLSARIGEVATGRIFVKSDTTNFYENQARNTKFCHNGAKLSGTLHEGLSKP